MRLSVIITTYNSPIWLEKVLWGLHAQQYRDFEVIIADDGSSEETAALLKHMRAETGLDLLHVWQPDEGFQKCRILNKAILHADAPYLVFTDGDCIARPDFLAEHARNAERGYYLSGSYCKLPMETSLAITRDDILAGRCFDMDWLRAHGLKRKPQKPQAGSSAATGGPVKPPDHHALQFQGRQRFGVARRHAGGQRIRRAHGMGRARP